MYDTAKTTITHANAAATADMMNDSLIPPTASEFENTPEIEPIRVRNLPREVMYS